MMMEGLESKSESRKELERERRRIRDRQRRQSMSLEEREKHLARRRRNYQLRRQRAETARLNPPPSPIQFQQTSISTIQLPLTDAAATCVSDVSPKFNDVAALVRSNNGQQRLMLDTRSSQCLELPAHKLAILSGKVRLNRIKHLARAINDPAGDGVAIGGMVEENVTSNCLIRKGLRLNRIKRLARALNAAVQETHSQSHQSITEAGRRRRVIGFTEEHQRCRQLAGQGSGMFRIDLHDDDKNLLLGLDRSLTYEQDECQQIYGVLLPLCKSCSLSNALGAASIHMLNLHRTLFEQINGVLNATKLRKKKKKK